MRAIRVIMVIGFVCLFTAAVSAGDGGDPARRTPVYAFEGTYELNQTAARSGPGILLGSTIYDVQQMCSMGRQVEHRGTDYLHFSWTMQTQPTIPWDRIIVYQAYDLVNCSFIFIGPAQAALEFSGYVSLDADPGGCAVIGGDLQINQEYFVPTAFWDFYAGSPMALFLFDYPGDVYGWYHSAGTGPGDENLWPKIEWQIGSESVLHMVASESYDFVDHNQPDVKTISYYRRVGPFGVGMGTWSGQQVIDTVTNTSVTVAASPVSDRVAVVWSAPMDYLRDTPQEFGHRYKNDIWYMMSYDQGITWQTPVNITQYPYDGNWRAACDISALFTGDDMLHIVWNCRRWFGPADYMFPRQAGIFHWSEDNPSLRTVYKAFWDNNLGLCDGHEWGGDVGKMSVSECDGRLYILFSQFGRYGALCQDVAASNNLENGELYLTVSDDAGYTWDPPQNLTNTVTNNCQIGNCDSDYWASMARYGRVEQNGCQGIVPGESVLDILYINDRNPGSAVSMQDQAIWSSNSAMWLPTPCREAVPVEETPNACCLPDGSCVNTLTQYECEVLYQGTWYPNTPCTPSPCLVDISGTKFFDENRNSVRDGGEGALQNWTIMLTAGNKIVSTTTTDVNGAYAFTDLWPGQYTISELMPTDKLWIQTFPAPSSHMYNFSPGQDVTGINFGNWTPDTLDQKNCIRPANGLFDWWPFNEAGKTIAYDIAGRRDGVRIGTVPDGVGKVRGAYHMTAANTGFVRVFDDPFQYIGDQDFTLDAWVYLEECSITGPVCNKRIIMDNHRCGADRGITFFLEYNPNDFTWRLGLRMNQAPAVYSAPMALLMENWIHVAVSVSRQVDPPSGRFYFDGLPNGPVFTPILGNLYPDPYCCVYPILDIGHASPEIKCSNTITHYYFDGWMDEVEIFKKALSGTDVWNLYQEDYMGKCYEHCNVPASKMFCLNDFHRTVQLTICNESNLDATYSWNVYGFVGQPPLGYIPGNFSPQQQSGIFIPAWQCRQINITMDRPQNAYHYFSPGDVAFYDVIVKNELTGSHFMCRGSVFATNDYCLRDPDIKAGSIYDLSMGDTAVIEYRLLNTGDSIEGGLDYEISVVAACNCDSALMPGVSLNGLPPGTPVTGSVSIPYGDSATVSVSAVLTEYQALSFAEVVLRSDWNGDGTIDWSGYAELLHPRTFPDCNDNGIDDSIDIADGFSADTNGNYFPDECELSDEPCYLPGDANNDNQVNVADAVYLINYVFRGGLKPPCQAEGDANGDCGVNVGDAVYLISYVFREGPPPYITYECQWP